MKRGVKKKAVFCPVRALILDHITISLGKFKVSGSALKKGGGGTLGVVATMPGCNSALKFSLENKNNGWRRQSGFWAPSGCYEGWRVRDRVIRGSQEQSPAPHPNNLYPRGLLSFIWILTVSFINDSASISVKHFYCVRVCVCVATWGSLTTSFNPSKMSLSLQTHYAAMHGGIAPQIESGIIIYFNRPLVWNTLAERKANAAFLNLTRLFFLYDKTLKQWRQLWRSDYFRKQ